MRSYAAKPASAAALNRLLNAEPDRDSGIASADKVSERRRQRSEDAWHCLRGAVERQHAAVAAVDPTSPRVRPTLASLAPSRGRVL